MWGPCTERRPCSQRPSALLASRRVSPDQHLLLEQHCTSILFRQRCGVHAVDMARWGLPLLSDFRRQSLPVSADYLLRTSEGGMLTGLASNWTLQGPPGSPLWQLGRSRGILLAVIEQHHSSQAQAGSCRPDGPVLHR